MNTELDRLTANMQQNEARAAGWLYLGNVATPGSALQNPDILNNVLAGQKSLSQYMRGLLTKAAQDPITTASGLAPSSPMTSAILDLADRRAILPQLGAVQVPTLRTIGAVETSDPSAAFVAEGAPAPMSAMAFTAAALDAKKLVAAIAVSRELLKFGVPRTTSLFERRLTAAVAKAWNSALLDATAGSATRPAGLLNGLVSVAAGADLQSTLGAVLAAVSGGAPSAPVVITSIAIAARLLALRDLAALGVKILIAPEAGARIIVADADGIAWVDGGGEVGLAENGTAQLDSAPTDPTVAATVLVDFWGRNLVGIMATRFVGWTRRADSVAFADVA